MLLITRMSKQRMWFSSKPDNFSWIHLVSLSLIMQKNPVVIANENSSAFPWVSPVHYKCIYRDSLALSIAMLSFPSFFSESVHFSLGLVFSFLLLSQCSDHCLFLSPSCLWAFSSWQSARQCLFSPNSIHMLLKWHLLEKKGKLVSK